jgi:redox-sensitive bicupin YhaK (pirin superfamily)
MISLRSAADRGTSDLGWLDSRHTFSFADYHDAKQMGFRTLRVINDDRVAPGAGFPTHPHRDMEIVTYVLDGAIEHKDSMGNGSVIRPGEIQRMSAGTGVTHSEFNHSKQDALRFLQIWILPERRGIEPGYEQKKLDRRALSQGLVPVASREGGGSAVLIHQDATIYATLLARGSRVTHTLAPGRHAWVQVARGAVLLEGLKLAEGDGAAVSDLRTLTLEGVADEAEVLLFDLA